MVNLRAILAGLRLTQPFLAEETGVDGRLGGVPDKETQDGSQSILGVSTAGIATQPP